MANLIAWDAAGARGYETGLDRGVLYPMDNAGTYPEGVAWDGLTAFTNSPSGAEPTDLFADNIKYGTLRSAENLGFTIEAYKSPKKFDECDGSVSVATGVSIGQQSRKAFGLCYRTQMGNDTGDNIGYKLHLIYGATASPSEKAYTTINDSPEAMSLSWEGTTIPANVTGHKPTAEIIIDSTTADPTKLAALEAILYGTAATTEPVAAAVNARLPLPDEVITLMTVA